MKVILMNSALLIVLGVAVSSLSGCGSGSGLPPGQADLPLAAGGQTETVKKSSDYPPIADAIAQSDIKNLDGSTFKIADKKGKVLLLNMWATWCGPCRAEMPALVKMQSQLGGQGLEIIGLNADNEEVAVINDFANSLNVNYPLVWPDTKLQNDLLKISQFGGIPQSFLIDREGRLRGVFRGANPADVRKMETIVTKIVTGDESAEPAGAPAPPSQAGSAAENTQPSNSK